MEPISLVIAIAVVVLAGTLWRKQAIRAKQDKAAQERRQQATTAMEGKSSPCCSSDSNRTRNKQNKAGLYAPGGYYFDNDGILYDIAGMIIEAHLIASLCSHEPSVCCHDDVPYSSINESSSPVPAPVESTRSNYESPFSGEVVAGGGGYDSGGGSDFGGDNIVGDAGGGDCGGDD